MRKTYAHVIEEDFPDTKIKEQLSTGLTWFQDFSVISYYSSRHVAGKTSEGYAG